MKAQKKVVEISIVTKVSISAK